jgi:hypothetical protein
MNIISRQIGWSQESNLLYNILQQIQKLLGISYKSVSLIEEQNINNPPYVELLYKGTAPFENLNDYISTYFTTIDGILFTELLLLYDTGGKSYGCRLFGGKNVIIRDEAFANGILSSIIDTGKIIISLEKSAFNSTFSLSYVFLPGIVNIYNNTIFAQSSVKYINLPNLETIIGDGNFSRSSLEIINAPKLKTIIGESQFNGCNILTSVNLPNLIEIQGPSTFEECTAITNINIPKLKILGNSNCEDNNNSFVSIVGNTITLTTNNDIMTCNSGDPEADIQALLINNTVTIIIV